MQDQDRQHGSLPHATERLGNVIRHGPERAVSGTTPLTTPVWLKRL
jgi:hypothetical protein